MMMNQKKPMFFAFALSGAFMLIAVLAQPVAANGQDRDRDRDYDRNGDRVTTITPGTLIPVRTNEAIDIDRSDNRVFTGTVDRDVRGDDGHLAIPAGSQVELMVRVAPDNDLVIDLDSVTANGERYAIRAQPHREEAEPDNSVVGAIVGSIQGQEPEGRTVRIRRDTVINFRINRPLDMGVADRGYMRDGIHYHGEPPR